MTKPTLAEKTKPLRISGLNLSATSVNIMPGLIEVGGITGDIWAYVGELDISIPAKKVPSHIQFDPSVSIGASKIINDDSAYMSISPACDDTDRFFAFDSKKPMLKLVRKYYKKHLKSTTERKNHHE